MPSHPLERETGLGKFIEIACMIPVLMRDDDIGD
jgi:hypothetical protein